LIGVSTAINDHETRLLHLEGDIESTPMTQGQRTRLNERLRYFCSQTNKPHSLAWKDLHDITGKQSINDYSFQDYKIALSRIREWFKAYNVQW
jgi:hypothetical protein